MLLFKINRTRGAVAKLDHTIILSIRYNCCYINDKKSEDYFSHELSFKDYYCKIKLQKLFLSCNNPYQPDKFQKKQFYWFDISVSQRCCNLKCLEFLLNFGYSKNISEYSKQTKILLITLLRLYLHPIGELAQLVERLHGMQEVTGSNPVFSTKTLLNPLF